MVATGTAGPRRFRYGAPRDLLIGITIVRADGVVAHSGGKVVKNVAGYDLGKLFSGSQGTLGLITEVTFRLHPRPAAVAWVTGDFGPSALAEAAAAVGAAAGSALVPSAVELAWSAAFLRMGVLLEGTDSGVAERAGPVAELIASAGGTAVVARSEVPFRWFDLVPEAGAPAVVVRRVVLGAAGWPGCSRRSPRRARARVSGRWSAARPGRGAVRVPEPGRRRAGRRTVRARAARALGLSGALLVRRSLAGRWRCWPRRRRC